MRIKQYEYCNATDVYELEVDDAYVAALAQDLRNQAVHPEEIPELTPQIVCQIYSNGDTDAFDDKQIELKGWTYATDGRTVNCSLYDEIREWVAEDVYDNYCDQIDSESYDSEVYIED